jgi:hypothetical protein
MRRRRPLDQYIQSTEPSSRRPPHTSSWAGRCLGPASSALAGSPGAAGSTSPATRTRSAGSRRWRAAGGGGPRPKARTTHARPAEAGRRGARPFTPATDARGVCVVPERACVVAYRRRERTVRGDSCRRTFPRAGRTGGARPCIGCAPRVGARILARGTAREEGAREQRAEDDQGRVRSESAPLSPGALGRPGGGSGFGSRPLVHVGPPFTSS